MRLGCLTLGNRWTAGLFAAGVSLAHGDSVYLNEAGRKNLETIRQQIAPAPVFEDPVRRMPYIRCMIVGERAALNPTARADEAAGQPDYDLIAFDAGGDQRSATAKISGLWINHIDPDFDTDLDVRWLFSNRDQAAGVALASRAYFGMARRAVDPQGQLGLWRHDLALPPETAGVKEGALIRFLLDPPVLDASGNNTAWAARKQAEDLAAIKHIMARRLPLAHPPTYEIRPVTVAAQLINAVARERAYRLSRAGFDRTALGMLVFLLDLAVVKHRENPMADDASDAVYLEGIGALEQAITTITEATPTAAGHAEPPALMALMVRHASTDNDAAKRKIAADYATLQARLAATPRTSCAIHRQFCLDESQRAAAAIDALMACEGVYAVPQHALGLAGRLLDLLSESPTGLNFHQHDRVDVRDAALRLLAQLLNPPKSPHADRQRQRRDCARELRADLHGLLQGHDERSYQHAAARRALAAGGWGPADEVQPFVTTLFDAALHYAADSVREPERRQSSRELAASRIATLRAVAELIGSQTEADRATANTVLGRLDQMRRDQRDKDKAEPRIATFLEIWDAIPPAP